MLAAQHAPLKKSGLLDEMRLLANVSPCASASGKFAYTSEHPVLFHQFQKCAFQKFH